MDEGEIIRAAGGLVINNLPANMLTKIATEDCPNPGLQGMCWTWTGCLNSRGYGCVQIDKKVQLTHRVSYQLHVGEIPPGLQVDHLCRNKRCCNPHHLEAVTGKVNCERSVQATKTRCKQGHPLAGPNLKIKPKPSGLTQRQCRVCEMDIRDRRNAPRDGKRGPYKASERKRAERRAQLLVEAEAALLEWDAEERSDRALDDFFAAVAATAITDDPERAIAEYRAVS